MPLEIPESHHPYLTICRRAREMLAQTRPASAGVG